MITLQVQSPDINSSEVRKRAGLDFNTTNLSESINNVLKQEVEWRENKLPILFNHLKAIVGKGSYRDWCVEFC
jgi:rRNA maturation endonuclease Nob1